MSGPCPVLPDRLAGIETTLLVADYGSLEIGVQGDLCFRLFGDRQLIEMYDDQKPKDAGGQDIDIHSRNAREVFGKWLGWKIPPRVNVEGVPVLCPYAGERCDKIPVQEFKKHPYGKQLRQMIKEIWYGLAYGKGAYGFSTLIGPEGKMIGEERAGQMVEALLDAVPAMRKWFAWVEQFVREHHGIYSLGGRWCDLALEMESGEEWMIRRAMRRAFNFPCQATGADIIGDAMVRVRKCRELMELGFRIILQCHDELVLRGPLATVKRAGELLRECMVGATANGVALLVNLLTSVNWGPNYFVAK